jgi:hypothetical protein
MKNKQKNIKGQKAKKIRNHLQKIKTVQFKRKIKTRILKILIRRKITKIRYKKISKQTIRLSRKKMMKNLR